jgi:sporulation protein YlmC with PRC-barrel domain
MMHKDGQWRSSKLIGIDVYNDANEKIGDIEELIVDKSGNIEHVVLGVGGSEWVSTTLQLASTSLIG